MIVGEGSGARGAFLRSGCHVAVAEFVVPSNAHLECVAVIPDMPRNLPQIREVLRECTTVRYVCRTFNKCVDRKVRFIDSALALQNVVEERIRSKLRYVQI